jgi:hypothetical protein
MRKQKNIDRIQPNEQDLGIYALALEKVSCNGSFCSVSKESGQI